MVICTIYLIQGGEMIRSEIRRTAMKRSTLYLFMILWSFSGLYGAAIWSGTISSPGDDVVDSDILLDSSVISVLNNVHVKALNTNINIAADTGITDVTMQPDSDATDAADSILHLETANDHTITFDMSDFSLTFQGNSTSTSDQEQLLIVASSADGTGQIIFDIGDDEALTFTADAAGQPALFYIDMDGGGNVLIRRANQDSSADATVNVNSGAVMGYISRDETKGSGEGTLRFDASNAQDATDPSNFATGRLRLNIGDNGKVNVYGVHNTQDGTSDIDSIAISDIDPTTLAGSLANFVVDTPTSWGGLLVVNSNTVMPQLFNDPFCEGVTPAGAQPGYILGENGQIAVSTGAYFDYVGTVNNITPDVTTPDSILQGRDETQVIKDRNPSALFVDNSSRDPFVDPFNNTNRARFRMVSPAKMYFRSARGLTFEGANASIRSDFTVLPQEQAVDQQGYGNFVLDVEGALDIVGVVNDNTAINVLSLKEADAGGSVLIDGSEVQFKLRTFERDATTNELLQYGKAAFMINNRIRMFDTNLQHTDEIHRVFEKNELGQSEPTYVGGERLCDTADDQAELFALIRRPTIEYQFSNFLVHTSAALAGVDTAVPNGSGFSRKSDRNNNSNLVFYQNGYFIDRGTGRSLILGSNIGGTASDGNTILNREAHLDIRQESVISEGGAAGNENVLRVLTASNNEKVTEGLSGSAPANEKSVHHMYLAHETNLSIGVDGEEAIDFYASSDPTTGTITQDVVVNSFFFINGNFLAIESQGGKLNDPATSLITGQGAIYVDKNGTIEIAHDKRGHIAAMIGQTRGGAIDLPKDRVQFDNRIGIANPLLNLANQQVIISSNKRLSDYTLDWKYIIRDTDPTSGDFVPYIPGERPAACQCSPVTTANITNIPSVQGEVDQLQVRNSRLGDPVHLVVDGGLVRELVFQSSNDAGAAPVGNIVLQNGGVVGLGSAHRNIDSLEASVVLGINGVTVIANGDGKIQLNEDILVNNVCHFLQGPDLGASQVLRITSEVPRELRVKRGAVLDLSQFTDSQRVEIGGKVQLIFEPGSYLALGEDSTNPGPILEITENAQIIFEPEAGSGVASIGDNIVTLGGTGRIFMTEDSQMIIPRDAFVGVMSIGTVSVDDTTGQDQTTFDVINCGLNTDIQMQLFDSAKLRIDSDNDFGRCIPDW